MTGLLTHEDLPLNCMDHTVRPGFGVAYTASNPDHMKALPPEPYSRFIEHSLISIGRWVFPDEISLQQFHKLRAFDELPEQENDGS